MTFSRALLLLCGFLCWIGSSSQPQFFAQQPTAQQPAAQQPTAQQPAAQQPAKPAAPAATPPAPTTAAPQGKRPSLANNPNPTVADVNTDITVDKRVIVMMAALNVAGYDYESGNRGLNEWRQQIRQDLKDVDPTVIRKLRDHFLAHRKGRTDAAAVAPYLSLALSLTEPPAFTIDVPADRLPDDVREITDFALLLEEFYRAASFTRLLPKYVAAYTKVVQTYPQVTAITIGSVLSYLHTEPILELPPLFAPRVTTDDVKAELALLKEAEKNQEKLRKQNKEKASKEPTDNDLIAEARRRVISKSKVENRIRRFIIMPDLLNATGAANLRIVRDDYFLLLGPTSEPNADAMRRAFLNFVLDPLAERQVKAVRPIGEPLKKLMDSRGERLDQEYASRSAYYLITDSLVRATDARMQTLGLATRRPWKEDEALYELSLAYDRGAVLVFNFYDKVKAYESVGVDVRDYYTDLLANIDFEREKGRLDEYAQRFARVKQARLEAAAAPAPAAPTTISNADEIVLKRIADADGLIRQRKFADAKAVLEAANRDRPNNARVLFGLADATSKLASTLTDADRLEVELFAAIQMYKDAAEAAAPTTETWLAQRSYYAAGKILDFIAETQLAGGKADDAAKTGADALAAYELALKLGKIPGGAYDEALKAKEQRAIVKPKN